MGRARSLLAISLEKNLSLGLATLNTLGIMLKNQVWRLREVLAAEVVPRALLLIVLLAVGSVVVLERLRGLVKGTRQERKRHKYGEDEEGGTRY